MSLLIRPTSDREIQTSLMGGSVTLTGAVRPMPLGVVCHITGEAGMTESKKDRSMVEPLELSSTQKRRASRGSAKRTISPSRSSLLIQRNAVVGGTHAAWQRPLTEKIDSASGSARCND